MDQAHSVADVQPASAIPEPPPGFAHRLRLRLRELYYGDSTVAVRFRLAWLTLDLLIIAFFVAAPLLRDRPEFLFVDAAVAFLVAADLAARALASDRLRNWVRQPIVWVDLFVLATLLFPLWLANLGFLRILRLWTLVHSDVLWRTVGRRYDDTRVEDVTRAVTTLVTFVFIMTGFVYASFRTVPDSGIEGYLDALYFTVTSLTTTGYGDITLPGSWGRILSIVAMVVGITLFVRLAQAVFQPNKVRFRCPNCALLKHDPDAVHCKACGITLCIPDEGR